MTPYEKELIETMRMVLAATLHHLNGDEETDSPQPDLERMEELLYAMAPVEITREMVDRKSVV